MEKTGENLTNQLFTFKYPGREPKFLDEFLIQRPDILDFYIYDVNLTTGSLLYQSKGGIGVTKEPYIAKMHQWIKTSTVSSTLSHAYTTRFRDDIGKWRYVKLKEQFNEYEDKLSTWERCAELYLLWVGSNFTHRYRDKGYDGIFFPTKLKTDQLINASLISREKNLLFREEDFFSFREGVINDNVIVYAHLPREYGRFGAGWMWNEAKFHQFIRVINELSSLKRKVLISASYELRGRVDIDYKQYFKEMDHLVIPEFKESRLLAGASNSDIYLFNF
jgi:hypothetical protein